MTAERQRAAIRPIPGIRRPGPYKACLRFARLPGAYCHPERLARLLPDGLPASFRDRLQASARLRARLSTRLIERFALPPCTPDDLATPEGRFALLDGDDLQAAVRRVGAVWHARTIRRIILAERLRELVERLGRDNHRAALRFIDLAPADDGVDGDDTASDDDTPDIETLMSRIERDGLIAINAWCRHQPAGLGERLRLKLPPGPETDDEPPARHRDAGLVIVDRVMMTPAADSQDEASGHG